MFSLILKLFYIQDIFSTSNTDYLKDPLLNRIMTAFDNYETLIKLMLSRNIKNMCSHDSFEDIITKVKDILPVLNAEKYTKIKNLIINTNMKLTSIGYPYFETNNIILTLKRIQMIIDKFNTFESEECNSLKNLNEILYEEYKLIFHNVEKTVCYVGYKDTNAEILDSFENWMESNNEINSKPSSYVTHFLKTKKLRDYINKMIESMLPVDFERPVYVIANSKGFKEVIKCFDNEIHFFIREKPNYFILNTSDVLQYSIECSRDLSTSNQIDIEDYMDKTFFCNKITTELLMILFHYYSEIKGINTTYEIIRKNFNEYQIKWSLVKDITIIEIKEYWFKQEIPYLSTEKIIHKFGLILEYGIEYSTIRSEDTEDEPIETRLILLSCGHQLGFELIDEFLEYFYIKYEKPLKCHICRHKISLVGSYNAVVYRCK